MKQLSRDEEFQYICLDNLSRGSRVPSQHRKNKRYHLHYGFSEEMMECSYVVVIIHPSILGETTSLVRMYWQEKFEANTEDYLLLSEQITWQRKVLDSLQEIYNEMHNSVPCNPLLLQSQAISLCAHIADHMQKKVGQHKDVQLWTLVWKMT